MEAETVTTETAPPGAFPAIRYLHRAVECAAILLFLAIVLVAVKPQIMREALPHDNTAEKLCAGICDAVRKAACTIADKVTCLDGVRLFTDVSGGCAAEHIDALVFIVVHMMLGRVAARRDFDDVKAKACEARHIAQRLVDPFGIVIEKMRLGCAFHRRDFFAGDDVFVSIAHGIRNSVIAGKSTRMTTRMRSEETNHITAR